MKGTLKKIRSKAVVAFLCALVVFANVIPVSAAEGTSTPPHGCVAVEKSGSRVFQCYGQVNNSTHTEKYFITYECQTCHKIMGNDYIWGTPQSHSYWTYNDRGHVGENDHMYELVCKCGYGNTVRMTTCQGKETGRHVTPW